MILPVFCYLGNISIHALLSEKYCCTMYMLVLCCHECGIEHLRSLERGAGPMSCKPSFIPASLTRLHLSSEFVYIEI